MMTVAELDLPAAAPSATGISRPVLEWRTARLRTWLADNHLDALVVYGAQAVLGSRTATAGYLRYLTGWANTTLPSILVLPVTGTPTVLTMGPHDTRVFVDRAGWFGDVVATGGLDRYPAALGVAVDGAHRLGVLGLGEMPAAMYTAVVETIGDRVTVDAGPAVDAMRLVRHPEEVAMHRIGAQISDAMISAAMAAAVEPGMTAPELMATVEFAGRRLGAGTATTWLAVGEKPVTTYMEQVELSGPIGAADRVQLGTSLTYQGYFAQGLRIGVRGRVPARLAEYGRILIDIQDAALAVMRPGAKVHAISDAIEGAIDRACPYTRDTDPFRFQSCHGLGLSYVEPGLARDLNARRDRTLDGGGVELAENMVIEVHPNFTTSDIGHVCAGDMALVTADGAEWITSSPRGIHAL